MEKRNNQLIEYILSHNRRLISPVGGGSRERFNRRVDTLHLESSETIAQWLYFQTQEYGHDFVFSSIPFIDICKHYGLTTCFDKYNNELVHPGQVNAASDLSHPEKGPSFSAFLSNPYIQAIKEFKKLSSTPLGIGGFGPITMVSYVIGMKNFLIKCIKDPVLIEDLADIFTEFYMEVATTGELYGANYLWIGEPVVTMISPKHFKRLSNGSLKKLFDSTSLPGFLHVPGDSNHLIDEFVQSGAQCLSIDHHVDLRKLAYDVPQHIAILGNIDSLSMLNDDRSQVESQVVELNKNIRNYPNFIVSSGGGVIDNTPEDNLRVVFDVTEKVPVYNRNQYKQINTLWNMLAAGNHDLAQDYASQNYLSSEIISAGIDEALMLLSYQLENTTITREVFNRNRDRIELFKMETEKVGQE